LDVHKDQVFMAVPDDRKVRSGEKADSDVVGTREVPTNSPQLVKAIQRYQEQGRVFVAYEAGCLGFDLYHFLAKYGIDCRIIPANTVFRPGNEKKIKTDRRDAVLIARMEKRIAEVAQQPEYRGQVQKLRAFRGIDYLTALALVVETGDFRRFPSAGAFMSYLGLVPGEFSSGTRRNQGGITKAGNGHIRKLLTESARHYPRAVKESKRLSKRREGTSELVIARADKAMKKLHDRYYKMIHQKKNACVAITAVSRQLAGYIWGVMTMSE
jgi:transposase